MVTILALATVMQGRKLERDKATCTAPVATKGETAVVTCHYPLDVKQPGEIVSVTVERYPLISSSTGSPRCDYLLECMWHQNFTCTLDEEEHRVEGKEVVITIRNVAEDSQGRYLCKMMVKDGPNIHGDPCQLLVNGRNPSGPLPRTTDPAMDQPIIRDNDTGSGGGLGAGSVAAVVAVCVSVLVVVVTAVGFICRKRKQRLSRSILKPDDEDGTEGGKREHLEEKDRLVEGKEDQHPHPNQEKPEAQSQVNENDVNNGEKQHLEKKDRLVEGKEDQHPHSDQEKPGAQSQVNENDVNNENGQVAEPDRLVEGEEDHYLLADQERPGAQSQVNNVDVNYGNGPRQTEPGQQVERAERQTLSGQERGGPLGHVSENKLQERSEGPPGKVKEMKKLYENKTAV